MKSLALGPPPVYTLPLESIARAQRYADAVSYSSRESGASVRSPSLRSDSLSITALSKSVKLPCRQVRVWVAQSVAWVARSTAAARNHFELPAAAGSHFLIARGSATNNFRSLRNRTEATSVRTQS